MDNQGYLSYGSKFKMQEVDMPLWGPKKDLSSPSWKHSPSYLTGMHVSPRQIENVLMHNAQTVNSYVMASSPPRQECDWSPARVNSDRLGDR
eukprot:1182280-Prorocentrum_minimum.AAC.4